MLQELNSKEIRVSSIVEKVCYFTLFKHTLEISKRRGCLEIFNN